MGQAGFKTGSIWGEKGGPQCYGQQKSACGGKVTEWVMGGRNCFACAKRQILDTARRASAPIAPVKLSKTGTAHLGEMVSAAAAESRKRKSGEGLAVQHLALKDDATLAAARAAKKKPAAAAAVSKK